jgi:hypothetical protein
VLSVTPAIAAEREMLLPISRRRSAKDDDKQAQKPATGRARKRA